MNPRFVSDAMYSNERRVKGHRHNIIYALSAYGTNASQKITDEVNKKVEIDVEQEFDPNRPQNINKSKGQLDKEKKRELEFRRLSRETADKLLKRMVERGLVTKKHHVYTLTPEGRNENIFGEYLRAIAVSRINGNAIQRNAWRKTRGICQTSWNLRDIHLYEKFKSRGNQTSV